MDEPEELEALRTELIRARAAGEDPQGLEDTIDLLSDPDALAQLAAAKAEIDAGEMVPLADIRPAREPLLEGLPLDETLIAERAAEREREDRT